MKIFLIISFSFLHVLGLTQTTILFENFNNGFPAGWQRIDNDGGTPYNDPNVSFINDAFVLVEDYDSIGSGDSILIATSWLDPVVDADDFLILPAVTLGSIGNHIYFDTKSIDHSYPDGIQLLYTINDLSVDSIMNSEVLFDTISSPPYWTNFKVDLDSFNLQNKTVHFVFRHYGNDQFIIGLDNIHIEINAPSGFDSYFQNELSIYPNPSNGNIWIDGLKSSEVYKIYNLSGQIVQTGNANNNIQTSLNTGIYLLEIKNKKLKLIVK